MASCIRATPAARSDLKYMSTPRFHYQAALTLASDPDRSLRTWARVYCLSLLLVIIGVIVIMTTRDLGGAVVDGSLWLIAAGLVAVSIPKMRRLQRELGRATEITPDEPWPGYDDRPSQT